jgi:hypothetical protein
MSSICITNQISHSIQIPYHSQHPEPTSENILTNQRFYSYLNGIFGNKKYLLALPVCHMLSDRFEYFTHIYFFNESNKYIKNKLSTRCV